MDEMSAALGYAQMKRINEISKRKQKADNYFELFKNDGRVVLLISLKKLLKKVGSYLF